MHDWSSYLITGSQWLVVYERSTDRGASAIDLREVAPNARHWGLDLSGRASDYAASSLPRGGVRHLRRPLPIPVGPGGGGVDFTLDLPERARFQADIGIYGIASTQGEFRRWFGATYSVSLVRDGRAEVLSQVSLPPDLKSRGNWQPVEVDLSSWAGQRVVLRLQVIPYLPDDYARLAWWGSPRIVVAETTTQQTDAPPPPSSVPADASARKR
jgi:hypothetical protein